MGQLIRVAVFTKGEEDSALDLTANAKSAQVGFVMSEAVECFETYIKFLKKYNKVSQFIKLNQPIHFKIQWKGKTLDTTEWNNALTCGMKVSGKYGSEQLQKNINKYKSMLWDAYRIVKKEGNSVQKTLAQIVKEEEALVS